MFLTDLPSSHQLKLSLHSFRGLTSTMLCSPMRSPKPAHSLHMDYPLMGKPLLSAIPIFPCIQGCAVYTAKWPHFSASRAVTFGCVTKSGQGDLNKTCWVGRLRRFLEMRHKCWTRLLLVFVFHPPSQFWKHIMMVRSHLWSCDFEHRSHWLRMVGS